MHLGRSIRVSIGSLGYLLKELLFLVMKQFLLSDYQMVIIDPFFYVTIFDMGW